MRDTQNKKTGRAFPDHTVVSAGSGPEWNLHFNELKRFKEKFGHVRVPPLYPPAPMLDEWMAAQRTRLSSLSLVQIQNLWDVGMKFGPLESQWLFQFFRLLKGKEKFGNANDPRIWRGKRPLRGWVSTQRGMRSKGKILRYRARLLERIGFVWKPEDAAWEKRFMELLAYKARFGNALIPDYWPENPALGLWLSNQRRRGGKKEEKKKRRLEKAGCFIRREDLEWEQRFKEWRNYVREHGTTEVPVVEEHASIGTWIRIQRMKKRAGKLDAKKIRRLEATGLLWEPQNELWERRFAELSQYHRKYGHCHFSSASLKNPKLYVWCAAQRWRRKRGELSPDRIARLNALEFPWSLRNV